MKSFFAMLVFTMAFCKLSSQGNSFENTFGNMGRIYHVPNYDILPVETKGSRFFNNDTYVKGELKTPDSLYSKDLLFRFDQIDRTLQMKLPDGKEMLLDPRHIIYFKLFIEDKVLLFERSQVSYKREQDILQVIYSSPTMRLLRDSRKKKRKVTETDLYTSAPKAHYEVYENDYRYYLVFNNMSKMNPVNITKTAFSILIPNKASFINRLFDMKQFRTDLSITKLKDLIGLLDQEMQRKED
jgi:hypothetical protein